MAVIRQSEAHRIVKDAIVLDLGDLSRQAEGVRTRAKADAEAMLTKAAAERSKLISGAREEGLAQGLAKGRAEGFEAGKKQGYDAALAERRELLKKLDAAWAAALEEFSRERDRMLLEARQDVLRLAVLMGERVTKRKVELDPTVIVGQMEAVLTLLAKPTRLTVAIAPGDEALAREAMPEMMAKFSAAQHIDLIVDASMQPGSCVARTAAGGTFDASIPAQLDRMVAALMPAGRKEGGEEGRNEGTALPESSVPSSAPDACEPPTAAEGGTVGGT
jgi:flagellar assembly protein FliH